MIRHLSIAADEPARVAGVLASLLRGRCTKFNAAEGSYMALAADGQGTAIEVLPMGTEIAPCDEGLRFVHNHRPSRYAATHVAISVPANQAEIEEVAAHQGWKVRRAHRGSMEVIELWLENRFMLELIPPELEPRWEALRAS